MSVQATDKDPEGASAHLCGTHTEMATDEASKDVSAGPLDPEAEKKLLWKCDVNVLPCIALLYFLAFMDRTNIGNAKIQGMTKDLDMSGTDYSVALFVFFIPYVLFEVPSNILIKHIAPSTWLSANMALWGIATIGQGLVTNLQGLIACRFLLGLFEAGFVPDELQWRVSLFFCSAVIAGAFSGLLAFAIANLDGYRGYSAWRWIFIIEGIITFGVAVISKWWIADWPEKAKFLTDDERRLLVARLAQDTGDANMDTFNKSAKKRIFSDWMIYAGTCAYFGVVVTGYAGSFFIPTILNQMGYVAAQAQVRTIPIYIVATILCLCTAALTDRLRHRYAFTLFGIILATIGYVLLLCQQHVSVGVKYFALFLVVGGGYTTQPVTLAWLANNVSGHYKRSVASAVQVGFGNIGGIVASNVFFDAEAPLYWTGYGVSLGLLWVCAAACTVLFLGVMRENAKRERGERDWRLREPDADNLGDDHPAWRFTT
ncbi:Uu.00g062180.m01.CDS01 [Anthostomella pinea]|uniref:Uu.00g062180.m01.CDS01 n=1 Tax=Anthostomella pinea TaxID=933095 RepID=A0AAI8YMV1_9PEZI|nr:Uu.00g062180.m01.CDS01 [Anthostomella pinea]